MDWGLKDLLMAALTIGVPMMAGWVQAQSKKAETLRSDFQEFRLQVAEEYVRHVHLAEIKEQLTRIEAMLHTKADKRPYREGN